MPRTSTLVFIQASFPTPKFRAACDCKLFRCRHEETRASLPQGSSCSSMSVWPVLILMKTKWEHSRKNNLQMIFLSIFLTSSQVKKSQVVIILTVFSYLVFFPPCSENVCQHLKTTALVNDYLCCP